MIPGTLSLIFAPPSVGDEDFSRVLQRLLTLVTMWIRAQKDRVSEGYLVPEHDGLMLYVIGRAEAYDFDLGDKLTDFSVSLADQGMNVSTTLLPSGTPEELAVFVNPTRGPAILIPAG